MLPVSRDAIFGVVHPGPTWTRQREDALESIKRRPAGITILAVLAFATGVVYLLDGLRILGYVAFGPAQALSNISMSGWSMVFVGLLWIGLGVGFLALKAWALAAGIVIVGVSLIVAFFSHLNGSDLGELFMATILPLVVLFYLASAKVQAAFGVED